MNDMIMRMCELAEGGNIYTKENYSRLLAELGLTENDNLDRVYVTGLPLSVFEVFCTEPEQEDEQL